MIVYQYLSFSQEYQKRDNFRLIITSDLVIRSMGKTLDCKRDDVESKEDGWNAIINYPDVW